MWNRRRPDALDTRLVYRVYAGLTWSAGLLLFLRGPMWFGVHLPGQPFGRAALVRVFGGIIVAAGCFAAALAKVDDPVARRRGLLWLAAGHGVVLLSVLLQQLGPWDHSGAPNLVVMLLYATILVLLYLWWTVEGEGVTGRPPLISLFGDSRTSTQRLRSQYEQQIREAAGQEERNRLARDLHDSIKQQIFVIQTAAATAQARFDQDPAGARAALDQVRSSAREAIAEMEAMLDQLRAAPLENVGLVEALKKQCEALGFRTGARAEFSLGKLPPAEALAPGAQQAVFRVAQEALANVGRHARAANVLVSLGSAGGDLELRIQDDGAGFDPNHRPGGMGIANMRERAGEFGGRFAIESRPSGGTSVTFSIPSTVSPPNVYRNRALGWCSSLIVAIPLVYWTKAPFGAAFVLIAAIGLIREAAAYSRSRAVNEAAR
jgi:signal transduction histidine kinase